MKTASFFLLALLLFLVTEATGKKTKQTASESYETGSGERRFALGSPTSYSLDKADISFSDHRASSSEESYEESSNKKSKVSSGDHSGSNAESESSFVKRKKSRFSQDLS
ncbi:hypothetical protein ACRRTK_013276 [Alexandromys fortis]